MGSVGAMGGVAGCFAKTGAGGVLGREGRTTVAGEAGAGGCCSAGTLGWGGAAHRGLL
jgi:hypothetical protein